MEKRCYRCKEIRPLSNFSKDKAKKDGHKDECKKCRTKMDKEHYERTKKYIQDYKLSRGCAICGYNKYAAVLEFHHNGEKEFGIGTSYRSPRKIREEIKKCTVLCANCHRELHEKRRMMEGL